MTRYTYLLIDLLSLVVPLLFSFHPKIKLYKHWNALIPAILIVATAYTIWDSLFARLGIWGFNPAYLTGIHVGNLPLEEILFFICIPYSCVFTFECIAPLISPTVLRSNIQIINYGFAGILLVLALMFLSKPYTASAFLLLSGMMLAATFLKIAWLPGFYLIYGILLAPFMIVNGMLTGTGLNSAVVWYNPAGIIGLRILTIPVEDIFYGMGLILANIWVYRAMRKTL